MKSRVSGQSMEDLRIRRTAKRDLEQRLSASEARFRRLFETARDGILILDAQTRRIIEANPFVIELFGNSKANLIGKDLVEIGILTEARTAEQVWEALHRSGYVRFEHLTPNRKAEQAKQLEFVCNAYDEQNRKLVQCNIRDIDERKEGERRLREALEQVASAKQELQTRVEERTADLQQRNAELEAFSYSLSHDLRAPIRAIVSFTQIALDEFGAKLGSSGKSLLEKAISSAERLDHLIMDVLAFSKTTRQRIARRKVDVDRLLRDILQERPEWAAPKAEVIVESPLLPVYGDRASLTQCLTNLLDNAVKFVPAGVIPRVRVSTRRDGSNVRLCVTDNGIGIPASAQPRVFELFQRAHNGYEGHGIGLAVVRRAAERMGGHVGLSSEPGEGSTFWIELPGTD